jgi:hypothetical protein
MQSSVSSSTPEREGEGSAALFGDLTSELNAEVSKRNRI